jgi:hypothetical protein
MHIDQRVRNGLHRSADAIDPRVTSALSAVERVARRRRRTTRVVWYAVVTAAAAAVAIAASVVAGRLGDGSPDVAPAASSAVTGTYVVDVGDSEVARREGMVGRWVVALSPDGVVHFTPPPIFAGNLNVALYQVDGDVLHTDAFIASPGCQAYSAQTGTYRWLRTPSSLRLTLVSDSCPARRLLFSDQPWQVG